MQQPMLTLLLWPAIVAGALACTSSPAVGPGDAGSGETATPCVVATSCEDGGGFESAGVCTPCASAPSYKTEIAPILNNACVICHGPDGTAGQDENTYADVQERFASMLSFVNSCMMPPLNGPQLTDAQRVALTAWMRCGAPDN